MVGQVLNARGSFGPMMWAPIVNNLVVIAAGAGVHRALHRRLRGTRRRCHGGAIALLGRRHHAGRRRCRRWCCVPVLRRTGFRYRPRFDFRGAGLGKAGDLAKWTLLFVLVNQLAYVVIVNLGTRAGRAGQGRARLRRRLHGVHHGYLIFILPHSIITVSVVTGLLPRMSRAAADGDLDAVRDDLSEAWRLTGVGIVLAAAGATSRWAPT